MFIIKILVFGLIFVAIIGLVILRFMYKGIRSLRDVQEEMMNNGGKRFSRHEYIKYQQEQRDKNPFGNDYFKSSTNKSKSSNAGKQNTTHRTTTTSSGVTIIDDRDTEEKRKIFDDRDGEYVEFEEVSN